MRPNFFRAETVLAHNAKAFLALFTSKTPSLQNRYNSNSTKEDLCWSRKTELCRWSHNTFINNSRYSDNNIMQLLRPLSIFAAMLATKPWRLLVVDARSVVGSATAAARTTMAPVKSGDPLPVAANQSPTIGFAPDTVYACQMKLPLVGRQSFRLHLVDDQTAEFVIKGAVIQLQDALGYRLDRSTGQLTLTAQPATLRVLRRFGLSLGTARYDATTDQASLDVTSRVVGMPSVRLHFRRQQQQQHGH